MLGLLRLHCYKRRSHHLDPVYKVEEIVVGKVEISLVSQQRTHDYQSVDVESRFCEVLVVNKIVVQRFRQ